MNDTLINDVFTAVVADAPPATFDVDRAIRLGRRRRRAWIAGAATTAVATVGIAVVLSTVLREVEPPIESSPASESSAASPTGFPYASSAQLHALPNANYTPPADLSAVRLANPAPGFPHRLQPDALYAMTIGAGPACYGAQFAVSTAAPGRGGSSATIIVTDCAPPRDSGGLIEGHPIVAHGLVAGADGAFTRYPTGGSVTSSRNLSLYFTTGRFTTRIEGTGLSQDQLVALGDALTSLR